MKKSVLNKRTCNGFTMVELLVAMVVLSVGLVGLASLQLTSLKLNHSSYLRSQATVFAYDMLDRMRANSTGVVAGSYNNIVGIAADPACISVGCTTTQMAQHDGREWNQSLSTSLPFGQGTVVGDGTDFTITVMWDDERNGAAGPACSATGLKCFTVTSRL